MKIKKELSKLRISRLKIGTEILIAMNKSEEFPISNMHKVTDRMMEYFYDMNYEDRLQEEGSVWLPDNDYWKHNFKTLRQQLREEEKYLEYVHIEDVIDFTGNWEFCDKKKYIKKLKDDYGDISKRTETYNDKLDDGGKKWDIKIPGIPQPIALN